MDICAVVVLLASFIIGDSEPAANLDIYSQVGTLDISRDRVDDQVCIGYPDFETGGEIYGGVEIKD
jgi:hypothetical protein